MSTTQCVSGGVSGLYATGKALLDAGVIAGNDVTPEAALTKLSYVISKKAWSIEKKRLMMQASFTFPTLKLTSMNLKNSLSELLHKVANRFF